MIHADSIKVDNDEGRITLVIGTEEFGTFTLDIHNVALKLYDDVRREIGPYAHEAEQARADISTGTFSVRGEILDMMADAYEITDPKHPAYVERMVD